VVGFDALKTKAREPDYALAILNARIASANPRMPMTRLMLYANTCKLISVATLPSLRVGK